MVLDLDDKMILKLARANTYISHHMLDSKIIGVEAKSYYSEKTQTEDKTVTYDNTTYTFHYDYTDISYVKTMLHEAVHIYLAAITQKDASDLSHSEFAKYRNFIVNGLKEYLADNNLSINLSEEELSIYAWQGVEKSRQFKAYLLDLAKKNKTTLKEEKAKYYKNVTKIEYKLVVVKKEENGGNKTNSDSTTIKDTSIKKDN